MSDDKPAEPIEALPDPDDTPPQAPQSVDYADPGEDPKTGVGGKPVRRWHLRRKIRRWRSAPMPVENFDQAQRQHRLAVQRSNLNFRRIYAWALLAAMIIQVGIADWFFWIYMRAYNFQAPVQAMSVWLAAVVIEVIGLVVIITRYLFPTINNDDE